jgi:hypothetical protein
MTIKHLEILVTRLFVQKMQREAFIHADMFLVTQGMQGGRREIMPEYLERTFPQRVRTHRSDPNLVKKPSSTRILHLLQDPIQDRFKPRPETNVDAKYLFHSSFS